MLELILIFLLTAFYVISPLLIHEMGHWMLLHRAKVPIEEYWIGLGPVIFKYRKLRVGMLPIGGAIVPEAERYKLLTSRQRMHVALGGPIASFIYGFSALAVWAAYSDVGGIHASYTIAMLNFFLALVNIIPIPPLDGFQAFVSYREDRGRPLSGRVLSAAYRLGNGFVYGIGFLIVGSVFFR